MVNGNELCDDAEEFNYQSVGDEGHDGQDTCAIDASLLVSGENTITFTVKNFGREDAQEGENPAGLLYKLTLNSNECVPPPPVECPEGTHAEGDECVADELPTCEDGEHLEGDQCVPNNDIPEECPTGTHEENNECVPDDEEETPTFGDTQCSDGIDNDGDNKIDYPADNGCKSLEDDNETKSGGGSHHGGGSGGGYSAPQLVPTVLGAETSCGIYVDKFMKKGLLGNDVEAVKKLQKFLNDFAGATLEVNGIFDQKTEDALKAFQLAHADKILAPWHLTLPTGIFYLTTQTEVNNIMCPTLGLPIPTNLIPFSLHPWTPKA